MKFYTHLTIAMIALCASAGAATAGVLKEPSFIQTNIYTTTKTWDAWGEYQGSQAWSAAVDGGTPTYSNVVFTTAQAKRVNLHHVLDTKDTQEGRGGNGQYQIAHVWFTRTLNNPEKPAFVFYPWLAKHIAQNYDLVWQDTPPTNTPMLITPYYHNKWILHYTFMRDKDNYGKLNIGQNIDDYTVDQFGVMK